MDVDQTETNDLIVEFPEVAKEMISDWEKWILESESKN
jgi:hypothetical protein